MRDRRSVCDREARGTPERRALVSGLVVAFGRLGSSAAPVAAIVAGFVVASPIVVATALRRIVAWGARAPPTAGILVAAATAVVFKTTALAACKTLTGAR